MSATRTLVPLTRPPDAIVEVPGSKSLTNRALVAAALASGTSRLTRVLAADDTIAMLEAWRALGVTVAHEPATATVRVAGTAGRVPPGPAGVDARLSGTTARFLAPVLGLGRGPYTLDAAGPFRARPMGPTLAAVRQLGARVEELGEPGHLPVRIVGAAATPAPPGGGPARELLSEPVELAVPGDASSQFLSGLLLAAPIRPGGLTVRVTTELVSVPYVHLTLEVLRAFGVDAAWEGDRIKVAGGGYTATEYDIEPDASAASYLLAAAAITGGRVRVPGLGVDAQQGDVRFVDVLERMGAQVVRDADGVEVRGTGELHGVDVDMADLSDTAQTLAAVAVFADGPTRIRGIGFIRAKETDRIGAVVAELRRCGIDAHEEDDGLVVHPGPPQPATIRTYDDHRMAMSFALLGLRAPGIAIADPDCVAKTFPTYFDVLDRLRR